MDGQANKDLNVLKEAWLRLKCGKIARMLGGVFGLFENGGLVFVLSARFGTAAPNLCRFQPDSR